MDEGGCVGVMDGWIGGEGGSVWVIRVVVHLWGWSICGGVLPRHIGKILVCDLFVI